MVCRSSLVRRSGRLRLQCSAPVGVLLTAWLLVSVPAAFAQLRSYETRYYLLHTDLDAAAVREADLRLTAMAEMYYERVKGFGGRITRKLPVYLFTRAEDYCRAGGRPGSAGFFDGRRLMALARSRDGFLWQVLQHEGFHQFLHAFVGGDLPVWVNEGLAEYFGLALYTGDGFVTGLIPSGRLERLRGWISGGKVKSVAEMMTTSHALWNAELSLVNYDQAWSLIHFLAHAENGRYQPAFNGFIRDISRGMRWEPAWQRHFGSGTRAFERKWREYWMQMPPDPTADRYAQATVATLTSFYARAFSQRQVFRTFEEFVAAARAGRLRAHPDDWLPPTLLADALDQAARRGSWEVRKRVGGYELVCTLDDGTALIGKFKVRSRRVVRDSVRVTVARR